MNPVGLGPNSKKMVAALSKLKWLVVGRERRDGDGDLLEGAQGVRGARRRRRSRPRSSCFPPPTSPRRTAPSPTPRAGCSGSGRRSIRRARRRPTRRSWPASSSPCASSTRKEGGALPEQVLSVAWDYTNPRAARPRRGAEGDERQGAGRPARPQGQDEDRQAPRDSRSTASASSRTTARRMCGNWLHSGVYTEAGNNAQRRNTADPTGLGMFHDWAFSWPANRRVMYNRASADAEGKPWDPDARRHPWNGEKWVGDVPDMKPDAPPGTYGAFIMLPEGRGPALRAGPQRRAVPGALRGGGGADRQPAPPEGDLEPDVQEVLHPTRTSTATQGGVPDRLHDLPAHRALPLLDAAPARRAPQPAPAGLLRRDPGGAGAREGDRQRLAGEGHLRAGADRGRGDGHASASAR